MLEIVNILAQISFSSNFRDFIHLQGRKDTFPELQFFDILIFLYTLE